MTLNATATVQFADQCDRCGIAMFSDKQQRADGKPLWCVECAHQLKACEDESCACRTAKHYPTDPLGERDFGAESDARPLPCTRRTWCIREEHADTEPCHEVPRRKLEATDFGPAAAIRRRA